MVANISLIGFKSHSPRRKSCLVLETQANAAISLEGELKTVPLLNKQFI